MKTLIKAVLVLGLLVFLSRKGFLSWEEVSHALAQWRLAWPAFGLILFTTLLGIIRWHRLLKFQKIQLPFSQVFHLSWIGNFFNIALPGAVSGDFVKAFYIGKAQPGSQAKALGSILLDRLCGLSALVLVSAGALAMDALYGQQRSSSALFQALRLVLMLAGVGIAVFYGCLFLLKESLDPILLCARSVDQKLRPHPRLHRVSGAILRTYLSIREFRAYPGVLLQTLAISVVIHLFVGWAFYLWALALGETSISPIEVNVVFPLGILVTAVPVMPAGIGTGHAAFLYLFKLMGSERGADLFSLYAIAQMGIGAMGGLIYLRFRSEKLK